GEACEYARLHVRDEIPPARDEICRRTRGEAGRLHRLLEGPEETLRPEPPRAEIATSRRSMPAQSLFSFVAGEQGDWHIERMHVICGDGLAAARRLSMVRGMAGEGDANWVLRGVTSNLRYTTDGERKRLAAQQAGLGRDEARCAALIPIRKTEAWW